MKEQAIVGKGVKGDKDTPVVVTKPGETFNVAANMAVEMANSLGVRVVMIFNCFKINVDPADNTVDILRKYVRK